MNKKLETAAGSATADSDRKRKQSSDRSDDNHHNRHHHHYHRKHRHESSSAKKSKTPPSSEKVRASHILIKHQGSRRKASWKDPDGVLISATTRDEAVAELKSLRDKIVSGEATFKEIATQHSHCSSYKRGGDLGQFQFWPKPNLGVMQFFGIWCEILLPPKLT